jgi:hypothetical protein
MNIDEVYSEELEIASVHEPFRSALLGALKDPERTRKILYSPAFSTLGLNAPASLLAITDERWLVILDDENGSRVTQATFVDTLLIELSIILLNGQLKLDFVNEGASATIAVQFDIVSKHNYVEVVESLLAGMESRPFRAAGRGNDLDQDIQKWPLKFRNIAAEYLPRGRRVSSGVYWDAICGGFDREISPAGALISTEQELLLLAEEKRPVCGAREESRDKYGEIITYLPLRSLANYRIIEQHHFDILSLGVHAKQGGEELNVTIPSKQRQDVEALMQTCLNDKNKAASSTELSERQEIES